MANVRPKILFVSDCWPHGKAFGGQLRALHTARALQQIGPVAFLVVSDDSAEASEVAATRSEFDLRPPVRPQPSSKRGAIEKLRGMFDTRYLNVHGCAASAPDRQRVISDIGSYDLVWVLNARTPNVVPVRHWPHGHLDLSDVPSTYSRTVARSGASRAQRWKARIHQVVSKRRELLFKDRFTTLSVCSAEDQEYLGGDDKIHVIPNGFAKPSSPPLRRPTAEAPRIGFIGLYSYPPNMEGVRWFLKQAWPAIRQAVPGIRFRLAGKQTDGPLKPHEPDVDCLGYLADPAEEIATWSAMIIPIRFGGGTRVKLADAFSRKCPVVATSVGAFGYDVSDGRELLLADKPDDFSSACITLARDPARGAQLAEQAWNAFLQKWTWDAIAPKIWGAAEDCLRRSKS